MRGANNPLTPISLYVIRSMATTGDFTATEIGRRCGFSTSVVQRAIAGSGLSLMPARKRVAHARRVARVIAGESKVDLGYLRLYLPFHPSAAKDWIFEHRVIAERVLGRYLRADELVHHINRDRHDNRPENLAVMSKRDHQRLHAGLAVEPAPISLAAVSGTGSDRKAG